MGKLTQLAVLARGVLRRQQAFRRAPASDVAVWCRAATLLVLRERDLG